jgi:hypothetical protein
MARRAAPGSGVGASATEITRANARPRDRWLDEGAAAIWAGQLGTAQRALLEVADREVRRSDPALDFWSELLALLRCEPIHGAPRPSQALSNPWDQLRRLVQVERFRLPPLVPRELSAVPAKPGAPHVSSLRPTATRTLPVNPPPADAQVWPIEAERWPDEEPAARAVSDFCRDTPISDQPDTTDWSAETMMVRELTRSLPPRHPALPALLFEQATLAIAAGDPRGALDPLARLSPADSGPGGPFSPQERAQLALTWAIAADADAEADPDHRGAALPRLRAALDADLPHDVRRVLAFRLAEHLRDAGRIDEAVAIIGPPPHGDDPLGRYLAFRQMDAHMKAGRRAEALAEARAALGRHRRATIDGHTALAAIDDFAMRLLVGSPVTPESIEVLEALGDPSERLARVERFAQMAEAGGAHASGMQSFLWLMQNDSDENHRLHHLARASVAAALAGDRVQFGRTFAMLAGEGDQEEPEPGRPPLATFAPLTAPSGPAGRAAVGPKAKDRDKEKSVRSAGLIDSPDAERLYRSRRRERSLSWQRAMLIVARDALPALVESDDQANLKILVDRLQQHLTAHGRGPVDAELTTVYRAASAHLRVGARGDAHRVGSARRPILLGDIAVARRYDVIAPRIALTPIGPGALLWVPATGNDPSPGDLKRWTAPLGTTLAVSETKAEAKAKP